MKKASYKYLVEYKEYGKSGQKFYFTTGYVPAGVKMSQLAKYIQGRATDKKITKVTLLTQREYYPELEANGLVDVTDQEMFDIQQQITREEAENAASEAQDVDV